MNDLPQNVTSRYLTNLLHEGRNADFDILLIEQKENIVEEQSCGYYYKAAVWCLSKQETVHVVGASPVVALRRALEKFGVTFK